MAAMMGSHFGYKIGRAGELKQEGNRLFKEREFDLARGKYQQALVMLDPNSFYGASEAECQALAELSATLLFNVASCCFNQGKWKDAELIYSEALTINPAYVKAIFKRGMARFQLGEYDGSMEDVRKAHQLDPDNPDIRQGYERVRILYNDQRKKDQQKQKEDYSKIFSPNGRKTAQQKPTQSDKQQLERPKEDKGQQTGNAWWLIMMAPLAAAAIYQGIKYFKG